MRLVMQLVYGIYCIEAASRRHCAVDGSGDACKCGEVRLIEKTMGGDAVTDVLPW